MSSDAPGRRTQSGSGWAVPVGSLVIGGAMAAAAWWGGHPWLGAAMFGIMAGYALLVRLGGRWDLVRVLDGRPSDERWRLFDLRATAFTGVVLIVAVTAAFLVEIARGHDGSPYAEMGALAALAYIGALWVQSRRG